jgi:catechol 2,3-dioxygenase-like lactoylglutathione lyase family enzyme
MITGLNHLTISTPNLDRSFEFYTTILGFKPLMKHSSGAYLLAGDLWFCLDEEPKVQVSASSYTHFAFSTTTDAFKVMEEKIRSSGAVIWKENKSEGDSIYFLDPDGYKLELHVGSWKTRISSYKRDKSEDMTFFV